MNFAGHVAVARAVLGDDAVESHLIGAALPDLAAMGRFRLLGRPGDHEMARGVDLHHRTDDAFHHHRWFRLNSRAVTARLEDGGLARGPARACGHVGVELLLDGHLLARWPRLRTDVDSTIEGAGARADELQSLVDPRHRDRWREHLGRLSSWPVPADYDRPAAVAHRLQRILARRPRLAFDDGLVVIVAEVLADRQPALVADADELLADLGHALGPEG